MYGASGDAHLRMEVSGACRGPSFVLEALWRNGRVHIYRDLRAELLQLARVFIGSRSRCFGRIRGVVAVLTSYVFYLSKAVLHLLTPETSRTTYRHLTPHTVSYARLLSPGFITRAQPLTKAEPRTGDNQGRNTARTRRPDRRPVHRPHTTRVRRVPRIQSTYNEKARGFHCRRVVCACSAGAIGLRYSHRSINRLSQQQKNI